MKLRKGTVLQAEDLIPVKAGHTISKGLAAELVLFSLAADTDISAETYFEDKSYYVFKGSADICEYTVHEGEIILLEKGQPVGLNTKEGAILLEGTWRGEHNMKLEKGKVLNLKDQIDYIEGAIANVDLAKRDGMKFGLLAFDEGERLTPHSAPGDALIMALEGKAELTMGDVTVVLEAGEQFVFEKNIPHSVTPIGRFKMAILMVVED